MPSLLVNNKRTMTLVIFLIVTFFNPDVYVIGQVEHRLTLQDAIKLAFENNNLIKIARLRIEQQKHKAWQTKSLYFPRISITGNYLYNGKPARLIVPRGLLGTLPNGLALPAEDLVQTEVDNNVFEASASLEQPVTQLFKINSGVKVARMDIGVAEAEFHKARLDVKLAVEQLYFSLLIAEKKKRATALNLTMAQAEFNDAQNALDAGKILKVDVIGLQATVLEKEQELIRVQNEIEDFKFDLKELLGLQLDQKVALSEPNLEEQLPIGLLEKYLAQAILQNPQLTAARFKVMKSDFAVQEARREFIPDLAVFARHDIQDGVPILPHNTNLVGVVLKWNLFDFGERRAVIQERKSLHSQSEENLKRLENKISVQVEKSYRKLQRAVKMIQAAKKAQELRREELRLRSGQVETGLTLSTEKTKAEAGLAKAEADLLAAQLGYRLAFAELKQKIGSLE